jgi:hypothetical protein
VVTPHSPLSIDADLFAPYEVIGELGARPIPVYVARQSALAAGGAQLAVAEHFPGACRAVDASGRTDLRREARRISTLANPHVARVREVAVRGDDLVVFGDFLDGEKLTQFWRPGEWLPLEMALRVLLDVLTGVGALHGLRDSNQQPMKLTHGEISPATILFGADGVARLLHAVARRAVDASPEAASLPYLAPEVHANDAYDGRADVFSVGVLLWEVLEGKRLSSDGEDPAGMRARSGPIPAPSAPEKAAPWSKALVPVVTRALAAAPEDRWPTAAAMAAEIRKAAGLKLAAASAAAAFAKNKFGARAKERRTRWESRPSRPPGAAPLFGRAAPVVAPRSAPVIRSEEFSSSVLESYRPPPPPQASSAPVREPFATGWDLDAPSDTSPVTAPIDAQLDPAPSVDEAPAPQSIAPLFAHVEPAEMGQVDALVDASDGAGLEPRGARKDSAFSIPPLASAGASIPEPPPSAEAMVPIEAPVVFDESDVGPIRAPLGDASPLPPALSSSSSSGASAGARSRRRQMLFGGVAALGIAAASVLAVRSAHHATPTAVAALPGAPPTAAPALAPMAASAASPAGSGAATATPVSAAAPPAGSAVTSHASPARPKAGAKTKVPAVGGQHGKSGPVRPAPRSKPGAT